MNIHESLILRGEYTFDPFLEAEGGPRKIDQYYHEGPTLWEDLLDRYGKRALGVAGVFIGAGAFLGLVDAFDGRLDGQFDFLRKLTPTVEAAELNTRLCTEAYPEIPIECIVSSKYLGPPSSACSEVIPGTEGQMLGTLWAGEEIVGGVNQVTIGVFRGALYNCFFGQYAEQWHFWDEDPQAFHGWQNHRPPFDDGDIPQWWDHMPEPHGYCRYTTSRDMNRWGDWGLTWRDLESLEPPEPPEPIVTPEPERGGLHPSAELIVTLTQRRLEGDECVTEPLREFGVRIGGTDMEPDQTDENGQAKFTFWRIDNWFGPPTTFPIDGWNWPKPDEWETLVDNTKGERAEFSGDRLDPEELLEISINVWGDCSRNREE